MATIKVDITGKYYKIPYVNEYPPVYNVSLTEEQIKNIFNAPKKCNFQIFIADTDECITKKSFDKYLLEQRLKSTYGVDYDVDGNYAITSSLLRAKDGVVVGANYELDNGPITIDPNATVIGPNCFKELTLKSPITIPDSVKRIEADAFNGVDYASGATVTSIAIPDSVEYIGDRAFEYCKYDFTIGNGLKHIGDDAFSHCKITSFVAPPNLETIGKNAFESSSSLRTITLNDNLKDIGNGAFSIYYTDGTYPDLTIPASVEHMGQSIIQYCKDLVVNCKRIDDKVFNSTQASSITINEGVEEVHGSAFIAFHFDSNDKELVFPSSLKKIFGGPFTGIQPDTVRFKNTTSVVEGATIVDILCTTLQLSSNMGNVQIHNNSALTTLIFGESNPETGSIGDPGNFVLSNGSCSGNTALKTVIFNNKPIVEPEQHVFDGVQLTKIKLGWKQGEGPEPNASNNYWGAPSTVVVEFAE